MRAHDGDAHARTTQKQAHCFYTREKLRVVRRHSLALRRAECLQWRKKHGEFVPSTLPTMYLSEAQALFAAIDADGSG